MINQVNLSGTVTKIYPPVITPAGIKISRVRLEHSSEQIEGGLKRRVNCKIFCVYVAGEINPDILDQLVNISGFLSVNAQKELVLHITKIQNLD